MKTILLKNGMEFTPRLPWIQALHGRSAIVAIDSDIKGWARDLCTIAGYDYRTVIKTGLIHGMKPGKWLKRLKGVEDETCQMFADSFKTEKVKLEITCRYQDILRMSTSRHFKSCTSPGKSNESQIKGYLLNPAIFMIVIRDRSGDFRFRWVGRYKHDYNEGSRLKLNSGTYGESKLVKYFDYKIEKVVEGLCLPLHVKKTFEIPLGLQDKIYSCYDDH